MDDSEERRLRLEAKTKRDSPAGHSPADDEHEARLLGQLTVGDTCFAWCAISQGAGAWYRARLLGTRTRDPRMNVELLATIDGRKHNLPAPRRRYVRAAAVRLESDPPPPPPPPPPNASALKRALKRSRPMDEGGNPAALKMARGTLAAGSLGVAGATMGAAMGAVSGAELSSSRPLERAQAPPTVWVPSVLPPTTAPPPNCECDKPAIWRRQRWWCVADEGGCSFEHTPPPFETTPLCRCAKPSHWETRRSRCASQSRILATHPSARGAPRSEPLIDWHRVHIHLAEGSVVRAASSWRQWGA